ncbi:MAG: RNA ligase [Polyangiaceae bacterium]
MKPPLTVDATKLNRSEFKVVHEEGETLVIPLKDKYRWDETELHLRSLVLDSEGRILSAGFPKFFNYGENAAYDQALRDAVARHEVELTEKIDGSLLIADRIHGKPRFRTRGRRHLGEFTQDVNDLIDQRYPKLNSFLTNDPLLDRYSLLFELVLPSRAVVLQYDEAKLVLLALVEKSSVTPTWEPALLDRIEQATGVRRADRHTIAGDLDTVIEVVRGWKNREGVVARFMHQGRPLMLKIKAADYLRLHAYRSILGGVGARKIAWLLDLQDSSALEPELARYGLDWEAAQFARAEVEPYLARRREAMQLYLDFTQQVFPWMGARSKQDKRAYVEQVKQLGFTQPRFAASIWFTIAMKLFDANEGDETEARLVLDGMVLNESPATLRNWKRDAEREIRSVLTAPVREWDG